MVYYAIIKLTVRCSFIYARSAISSTRYIGESLQQQKGNTPFIYSQNFKKDKTDVSWKVWTVYPMDRLKSYLYDSVRLISVIVQVTKCTQDCSLVIHLHNST